MYFDPGFGGMLLQVIVAAAAMGGAILFSFRKKIRNLFSKKKDKPEDAAPVSAAEVSEDDVIDTLSE